MTDKLHVFIENLFADAPHSKRAIELKEEIYQNLTDKYNDLLSEGKTPEEAYNISVASVGDISSIIEEMKREAEDNSPSAPVAKAKQRSALLVSVAVVLYILSVVPVIVLSEFGMETVGVVAMFCFVALATGLIIYNSMTKSTYEKSNMNATEASKNQASEKDGRKTVKNAISSALWSIILITYLCVSFGTGRWDSTWVIFLIGLSIGGIIDSIFALTKK